MGLYLSKDGVSKIWTKAKSTFQAKGNYVTTDTAQTISGVKTYSSNQVFTGYLDIRGTAAEKHLKTRGIGGSDGNGNESDLYLQYSSNYSTKFGKSGNGSLNSDGTITEAGTLLSNKYAAKNDLANYLPLSGGTLTGNLNGKYITGTWLQTTAASDLGSAPPKYGVIDANGLIYTRTLEETKSDLGINSKSPVESVIDYGNTNKTIKIGYSGNGLTASQILYIAGYTAGADDNEHKIKDISKDVLKSWLGYTEVVGGVWSPGSTWTATSGYVWIIYPYDSSANTFTFTYGSGDRTGYGFAILQGEGCIRYFSSTTQLTRYSTSRITFSTQMVYIKFKI